MKVFYRHNVYVKIIYKKKIIYRKRKTICRNQCPFMNTARVFKNVSKILLQRNLRAMSMDCFCSNEGNLKSSWYIVEMNV